MKVKIQIDSSVDIGNAANDIQDRLQKATGLMCNVKIIQNKMGSAINASNNATI